MSINGYVCTYVYVYMSVWYGPLDSFDSVIAAYYCYFFFFFFFFLFFF